MSEPSSPAVTSVPPMKLSGLEPGSPELIALLKLSTEVVERIVWEVVPELAEAIIRENLHDLSAKRPSN